MKILLLVRLFVTLIAFAGKSSIMTEAIPLTEEELAAAEREVRDLGGLDRDAAEVVLAEIRRCWREIAELRARPAKQGRPHATRNVLRMQERRRGIWDGWGTGIWNPPIAGA